MESINLNQKVKIKLTDVGRNHLVERHKKIHGKYESLFPRRPVEEDEQGYSTWQLWELMGIFGELMQFPTCAPPFETEIELVDVND